MYRPCKTLFERAQSAVNSTDLAGFDWDQWMTLGQPQEHEGVEESGWGLGNGGIGYGGEIDAVPGSVSGDFAFAVEQQFQASTSI